MKTKLLKTYCQLGGALCATAAALLTSNAQAQELQPPPGQNLFVGDFDTGNIYEYNTSSGAQSTFATGFSNPNALAFNTAGDLFVANGNGNDIIEITPGGVQSTFATGLSDPLGLAFNSAGNLFVGNGGTGTITEITPGGSKSTFATGLSDPWGMAFNAAGNLFVGNYDHYISGGGSIIEITSSGAESTFVSGLSIPDQIAFDNAGNLYLALGTTSDVNVYSQTGQLEGTISISGLENANGLAFEGVTLPVPEPSAFALLAIGAAATLAIRRRRQS